MDYVALGLMALLLLVWAAPTVLRYCGRLLPARESSQVQSEVSCPACRDAALGAVYVRIAELERKYGLECAASIPYGEPQNAEFDMIARGIADDRRRFTWCWGKGGLDAMKELRAHLSAGA